MTCKVAWYCDALTGFGHVARAFQLHTGLVAQGGFESRLICSPPPLVSMSVPPGAVLTPSLPRYPSRKDELESSIAIMKRRITLITSFLSDWQPDFLVVDHFYSGIGGELLALLDLVDRAGNMKLVAGVPYIENIWVPKEGNMKQLELFKKYNLALGYNEHSFDPVLDNLPMFPKLMKRRYVGVPVPTPYPSPPCQEANAPRRVVVLCGSGVHRNVSAFLQQIVTACRSLLHKGAIQLCLVAGSIETFSFLSNDEQRDIVIQPEGKAEEYMTRADIIVARCGYNTAYTVVQGMAPVIFSPRPGNGLEQIIRARKLAQLERVWNVDQEQRNFTEKLEQALREALAAPLGIRPLPFRTNAPERVAMFFRELI